MKAIVCDTGPLLAVLNDRDKLHVTAVAFFDGYDGGLVVPSLIVTEVCYLAQTQVGPHAEARFLDSIVAGEVKIEHPTAGLGANRPACPDLRGVSSRRRGRLCHRHRRTARHYTTRHDRQPAHEGRQARSLRRL